jgi:hypothetical protein
MGDAYQRDLASMPGVKLQQSLEMLQPGAGDLRAVELQPFQLREALKEYQFGICHVRRRASQVPNRRHRVPLSSRLLQLVGKPAHATAR